MIRYSTGVNTIDSILCNRGMNTTLIASLAAEGIGASMILEGVANGAAFA
jgi:hypothetical protein